MAVYGNRIARCNRGEGQSLFRPMPGILVHTINNPANLEQALSQCCEETTQKYFTKDIVKDLDLRNRVYISQRQQRVGNCSVANTNSMELALLYLQFEPLIGSEAAKELARAIKKGRTKDTRVGSVEDYLNWHRTARPHPPDLALLRQLYLKRTADPNTDRQVQHLIRQWVEERGINPEEMIPEAQWYR